MNKQTLILDSSQIQAFLECPQLWKYSYFDRIIPVESKQGEEKSSPAVQGSYGHKLLERYYKKIAMGCGLNESMEWALSIQADQICECGHELDQHTEIAPPVDGRQIIECNGIKCTCTNPIASKVEITANEKTKVANRFRDYCLTYNHNEFKPPSAEAVEVGFSYPLYEDSEHYFVLEGKIDLFKPIRKNTVFGFVDHKFQLRQRDLYKKSIQFRNYGMVTNAQLAMINYIRLKDKLDSTTLQQVPITFAMGEHDWWKQRLIHYYHTIISLLYSSGKRPEEGMPKNWGMCSGMFGYECDYTDLCNERDNGLRVAKIEQLYKIKPEWKPW